MAAVVVAAAAAMALLFVLPGGPQPRSRRQNAPETVTQEEASPKSDAPLPAAATVGAKSLLVEVRAPGTWGRSDSVTVEVDDGRKRVSGECIVNGPASRFDGLPQGTFVVSPVVSVQSSRTYDRLRHECLWPAPVVTSIGTDDVLQMITMTFVSRADPCGLSALTRTADGQSVPDVLVSLHAVNPAPRARFQIASIGTADRGEALFANLAPGFYSVVIESHPDGYQVVGNRERPVPLRAGQSREVGFEFEETGLLLIRILGPQDIDTPHPLALYRVGPTVWPQQAFDVTPGQTIELKVAPGRYYASSWTPGLRRASQSLEVYAGGRTEVVLRPERGGVEVHGHLIGEDDRAIAGALLNLNTIPATDVPSIAGQGTRSDSTGGFAWRGVDAGEYHLVYWDRRLLRPLLVRAADGDLEVELRLPPKPAGAGKMRGAVLREDGSRLVPGGAWVILSTDDLAPWTRFAVTNGRGEFEFSEVAPGTWRLWVEPGPVFGGFPRSEPVEVVVGSEVVTIDLRLG